MQKKEIVSLGRVRAANIMLPFIAIVGLLYTWASYALDASEPSRKFYEFRMPYGGNLKVDRRYFEWFDRHEDTSDFTELLLLGSISEGRILPTRIRRVEDNDRRFHILLQVSRHGVWDLENLIRSREQLFRKFKLVNLGDQFGLQHMREIPPNINLNKQWNDIFIRHGSSRAEDIILCRGRNTVPAPGCEHHFFYKGIELKVSYDRKNLENWQKIKQNILDRLNRGNFN